jgi:hypothetical protein
VSGQLAGLVQPGWTARASCAGFDADAFFPATGYSAVSRVLLRLCAGCPVRRSCLAAALLVGERGVWAGTSETGRETATQTRLIAGDDPARVVDDLLAGALPKPVRRHRRVRSGKADAA